MTNMLLTMKLRLQMMMRNTRAMQARIVRHRVVVFSLLAIAIILFAFYGLSDEQIYNDDIEMTKVEDANDKDTTVNGNSAAKVRGAHADEFSDVEYPQVENLIILPCHAIFAPELNRAVSDYGDDRFAIGQDPANWLMEPFQRESDDHISFFKHIELALYELHENIGNSALVFSGGYTKPAIELSEAASYVDLARKVGFLRSPYFRTGTNILVEEYARDSYENVLYSMCVFYKRFGKLPKKITIVGFGFKRERFLSSHLVTLGYYSLPAIDGTIGQLPDTKHVKYIGAGPFLPEDAEETYKENFWKSLKQSELKNALQPFRENPFGSKGSILHDKKLKRDPWNKHSEVKNVYAKLGSEVLTTLISLDDLEFKDAWALYEKSVLQEFPLYE
jgi:hypothetical protein